MAFKIILFLLFLNCSSAMGQVHDFDDFVNDPERKDFGNYMAHCKTMGYKIYQQDGLVFYGHGFIDKGIPADVYFLPAQLTPGQSFEQFVTETLENRHNLMYDLVFATLRYRVSDLAGLVASLKYVPALMEIRTYPEPVKVAYCKITFNLFYGDTSKIYPSNPAIEDISIEYENKKYQVRERQFPDEGGLPVYFEEIKSTQRPQVAPH